MSNKQGSANSILWKRAFQIAALGRGAIRGVISCETHTCCNSSTSVKNKIQEYFTWHNCCYSKTKTTKSSDPLTKPFSGQT